MKFFESSIKNLVSFTALEVIKSTLKGSICSILFGIIWRI